LRRIRWRSGFQAVAHGTALYRIRRQSAAREGSRDGSVHNFCYVEFETPVNLERALECDGRIKLDDLSAPLRIDTADRRKMIDLVEVLAAVATEA